MSLFDSETEFKRLFSVNLKKSLRLSLAEMTMGAVWDSDRGDMYPVLNKHCGMETRLLTALTPFMNIELVRGGCSVFGVAVDTPLGRAAASVSVVEGGVLLRVGDSSVSLDRDPDRAFILQLCPGLMTLYSCRADRTDMRAELSASSPELDCIMEESALCSSRVAVFADDLSVLGCARAFMDCGVAQADMRPVRYEDGQIIVNEGKVYFTFSARVENGTHQGVMSWVPGTTEFKLEGVIFYCVGDGLLGNDVAASLSYNRMSGRWQISYASFSHGHVIGYAEMDSDPRFGVNVIDATLMPPPPSGMEEDEADRSFYAKEGDEDPDIIYLPDEKRWILTLCRLVRENGKMRYRYFMFESDRPDGGFRFVACSESGEETGGSLIPIEGEVWFVCGNSFSQRASYRAYRLPDLLHPTPLRFDYDDGGFRGWGTVMPIRRGNRTRYFHLTFDRVRGSSYNWSYGNIYCFEAR